MKWLVLMNSVVVVIPSAAIYAYMYLAMDIMPITSSTTKLVSSCAVLLMDCVLLIAHSTLLSIDNRKRWNTEQIQNEMLLYTSKK